MMLYFCRLLFFFFFFHGGHLFRKYLVFVFRCVKCGSVMLRCFLTALIVDKKECKRLQGMEKRGYGRNGDSKWGLPRYIYWIWGAIQEFSRMYKVDDPRNGIAPPESASTPFLLLLHSDGDSCSFSPAPHTTWPNVMWTGFFPELCQSLVFVND